MFIAVIKRLPSWLRRNASTGKQQLRPWSPITPPWRGTYMCLRRKNPDSGLPIIKVFLNPLMAWIWIGVVIVTIGTVVALTPNMTAALATQRNSRATAAEPRIEHEPEVAIAGRVAIDQS